MPETSVAGFLPGTSDPRNFASCSSFAFRNSLLPCRGSQSLPAGASGDAALESRVPHPPARLPLRSIGTWGTAHDLGVFVRNRLDVLIVGGYVRIVDHAAIGKPRFVLRPTARPATAQRLFRSLQQQLRIGMQGFGCAETWPRWIAAEALNDGLRVLVGQRFAWRGPPPSARSPVPPRGSGYGYAVRRQPCPCPAEASCR